MKNKIFYFSVLIITLIGFYCCIESLVSFNDFSVVVKLELSVMVAVVFVGTIIWSLFGVMGKLGDFIGEINYSDLTIED